MISMAGYKISCSVSVLIVMAVGVLIGVSGIMSEQVEFLLHNYKINFVPTEISLEEDIVVLVAAFGVFLEHRCYLINKAYPIDIPKSVELIDKYSHKIGIFLILLAVFMEMIDLLFLAVNNWGMSFLTLNFIEVSILFSLNVIVSIIILRYLFEIILIKIKT